MIRWLNTKQIVPLRVRDDGVIAGFDEAQGFVPSEDEPDQPELYQTNATGQPSQDSENLVSVTIEPVPASEADGILATDQWTQNDQDGGGTTPTATPATETATEDGSRS